MKQTTKKIVTLLLTMATFACTSCGINNENNRRIKLSVGNWPSVKGGKLDIINNYKEEFEKEYTDVEIIPDTWKFDYQSFYPKAEIGMLPNVFVAAFTEFDKIVDGGHALDLTYILKEKGYFVNLNPQIRDLVSKDGKVYAIPYDTYAFGVAYNTEMYEKAGLVEADGTPMQPKTWDELAEFAVKIKEATGIPGFVISTTNKNGGWIFTNIAWSYGVDFMEQQSDGRWLATFNTDEMVQALQYIKDLKWKYDVLPSNVMIDQDEMLEIFAKGEAGLALTANPMTKMAEFGMKPIEYGMMAIPAGPARHVALVGGAFRCISNQTKEEQVYVALDWINHVGEGYKLDDKVKGTMEKDMKTKLDAGYAVGIKVLQFLDKDSEKVVYSNKLIDENYNMKPNAVRLYNESLLNGEIELQMEEPVCAQDLYSLLDNCIQQVIDDENADCRAIVEQVNYDFQTNYLDNLDYKK